MLLDYLNCVAWHILQTNEVIANVHVHHKVEVIVLEVSKYFESVNLIHMICQYTSALNLSFSFQFFYS